MTRLTSVGQNRTAEMLIENIQVLAGSDKASYKI